MSHIRHRGPKIYFNKSNSGYGGTGHRKDHGYGFTPWLLHEVRMTFLTALLMMDGLKARGVVVVGARGGVSVLHICVLIWRNGAISR